MRRKASSTKILEGTSRSDRSRKAPADPNASVSSYPSPFFPLTPKETQTYRGLIDYLRQRSPNGFHECDAIHVAMLVRNLTGLAKLAAIKKNPNDMVEFYQSGASNVTGKMTAMGKLWAEVDQATKHLGLSPASRDKIAALDGTDENKVDPLQEFLKDAATLKAVS